MRTIQPAPGGCLRVLKFCGLSPLLWVAVFIGAPIQMMAEVPAQQNTFCEQSLMTSPLQDFYFVLRTDPTIAKQILDQGWSSFRALPLHFNKEAAIARGVTASNAKSRVYLIQLKLEKSQVRKRALMDFTPRRLQFPNGLTLTEKEIEEDSPFEITYFNKDQIQLIEEVSWRFHSSMDLE